MAAPVASNVSFGEIGHGVNVTANASDVVSVFATDADTDLTAGNLTFDTVVVDGIPMTLAEAGFSFMAGAGDAGSFSLQTEGVAAFAGLADGESITVTVTFTVSDGTDTDTGTLTWDVVGGSQAYDAEINVLGDTVVDQEVVAEAVAGAGEAALAVSVTGSITLDEALDALDLTDAAGAAGDDFDALIGSGIELTLAIAAAANESTATATAEDASKAVATATNSGDATAFAADSSEAVAAAVATSDAAATANSDSIATAQASSNSSATATASNTSTAQAVALSGSASTASADEVSDAYAGSGTSSTAQATATNNADATAIASGSSEAVAAAVATSDATATAGSDSIASAQASDNSSATSTASNTSTAETVAVDNSDSTATGDQTSDAFAGSAGSSSSSASAEDGSDASAIAFDNSDATATATDNSDATGLATEESTTTSFADAGSSVAASANVDSIADVVAVDSSTATSNASNGSDAFASADDSSVANASATNDSSSSATAESGSAAAAVSDFGSSATADASGNSDATAIATAMSDAGAVATANSSASASANADSVADAVAVDDSVAVSNADTESDGTALATDSSVASASGTSDSSASASATGSSAAAASSDLDSVAVVSASDGSAAEATATDSSTASADAAQSSVSSAGADRNSDAVATSIDSSGSTAFAGGASVGTSNAIAIAQDSSVSNAIAVDDADANATSSGSSDALAVAMDNADATATADVASSSSAGATNGAIASAEASGSSTTIAVASDDAAADGLLDAQAIAADNSVALALALNDANAIADAEADSATRAVASAGANAMAAATGMQALSDEQTGGGGPLTAGVQDLIEFITSEVTVGKAMMADYAMNLVTQYVDSGGVLFEPGSHPSLEGLIERFFAPVATDDSATVNENASIARNAASGVLANDSDAGGDPLHVVSVNGSAASVGVAIVGIYGTLTLKADGSYTYAADRPAAEALNVGTSAIDSFTYQVGDDGFASGGSFVSADTATLEITVNGLNEAPVSTPIPAKAAKEGSAFAFNAAVHFSDADAGPGDVLNYQLTGAPTWLSIDAATGVLSGTPGFEDAAAGGSVTVTATDVHGASAARAFSLTVENTNRAPVITGSGIGPNATVSVAENTTAVTTVTATDPDAGSTRTFSLSGTDASKFAISPAGVLTFLTAPDFEVPSDGGGNNVYDVTVTVTDDGDLTDSQALAVSVTNVNEAPIDIVLSRSTVTENLAAGSLVGGFGTIDPEGAPYTYRIVADPDAAFQIDGNRLETRRKLDFEAKSAHYVRVEATDAGGLSHTELFLIDVTNIDDVIIGNQKKGTLVGAKGKDEISGLGGKDKLFGKGGNDTLDGGDGNDTLVGGSGGDKLKGGKGQDTASYEDAAKKVTANLKKAAKNKGDAAGDSYSSIEKLLGSTKNDNLLGDHFDNVIRGGKGDDKLTGHRGADMLTGNSGDDVFIFKGPGESTVSGKGRDTITDFTRKDDIIDLSLIDAKSKSTKSNQKFEFIGRDEFSETAGELRFDGGSKRTFVYGDTDGDGAADFAIELTGKVNLKESDFVL